MQGAFARRMGMTSGFNVIGAITELDRMCVDMETISAKTYHRGLGVGFADSAETRGLFAMALDHGWQRAYVLYVRGTPCAFWEGLMYRQSFFSDQHRPTIRLSKSSDRGVPPEAHHRAIMRRAGEPDRFWIGRRELQTLVRQPELAGGLAAPVRSEYERPRALYDENALALAEHLARKGLEKARLLQRVKTLWRRHVATPGLFMKDTGDNQLQKISPRAHREEVSVSPNSWTTECTENISGTSP